MPVIFTVMTMTWYLLITAALAKAPVSGVKKKC